MLPSQKERLDEHDLVHLDHLPPTRYSAEISSSHQQHPVFDYVCCFPTHLSSLSQDRVQSEKLASSDRKKDLPSLKVESRQQEARF